MVRTVWWELYGGDCMVFDCMLGTVWWGLYGGDCIPRLILLRDSGMIRLSEPPVPCQVLPMECPSVMNSDKLLKMCQDIPNFPQFPTLRK